MEKEECIDVLRKGVEFWNRWRQEFPNYVDLSYIDFGTVHLPTNNLAGIDFSRVNLVGTDLSPLNLYNANLSNALLNGAALLDANLSQANLTEAQLASAHLRGTILTNAKLQKAQLNSANFNGANLNGADLGHAVVGWTIFADIDLSEVKGLDTVQHEGPSRIDIATVYRSKGNIPEIFLRGSGLPDEFITYIKALTGKAVEFYSCFISYSTKDQEFANHLFADLQSRGVRCWFAPEDLKIGDNFRQRIDESIRLHDKLLLILSESSIASPWVEDEVESALERERKENRLVLFPISIDDAVSNSSRAWTALLRRVRHIGNFRDWKDHDQYQKVFNRLLRDLKAGDSGASRA